MIVDATLDHIQYVCESLRFEDYEEVRHSWVGGEFSAGELVRFISDYEGSRFACLDDDGFAVGLGGINHNPLGLYAVAWAVGSDEFADHIFEITRSCRKSCVDFVRHSKKPLIANSWDNHSGSSKWLESIGFKKRYSHKLNGEPFTLYEMGDPE